MYEPREDSFLLIEAIKKMGLRGERALDMGTGTGIIAEELAKRFKEVVACDISKEAVEFVKRKKMKNVKVVKSDLFSNIRGKFDLIVFNPPYLPCPYEEDPELCCGDGEIIRKFLRKVRKYLKERGKALLLVSSLTPVKVEGKAIASKKLGWEELFVFEIATEKY